MRLIDADEFVAELIFLYEDRGWHEREIHFSLADMRCNVDIISTVDAVEVVRCKDCKHFSKYLSEEKTDGVCWRNNADFEVTRNHFCSWGERKDEVEEWEG